MTMFEVDTWVVRRGKRKEKEAIMKEIFAYVKKHPEAADYVKSPRFFQQGIDGSPVGKFVLITEFESLTDMDKFYKILDNEE